MENGGFNNIEYLHMSEGDTARHKARCIFYHFGDCTEKERPCYGSSQCMSYREEYLYSDFSTHQQFIVFEKFKEMSGYPEKEKGLFNMAKQYAEEFNPMIISIENGELLYGIGNKNIVKANISINKNIPVKPYMLAMKETLIKIYKERAENFIFDSNYVISQTCINAGENVIPFDRFYESFPKEEQIIVAALASLEGCYFSLKTGRVSVSFKKCSKAEFDKLIKVIVKE